jgi:hypothetical protein
MAYDEELANRIRELIATEPDVTEQRRRAMSFVPPTGLYPDCGGAMAFAERR